MNRAFSSISAAADAPDERVKAVADFGFTERQARFLVTVMLHSGVCLLRQYTAFAGIVHGQKTRKFFRKLVTRGYARAYTCRHNRGRVYHVHHKPLYAAIGQQDSRLRRPMSAARVVEGLVLLDAVLSSRATVWLATDEERRAHLTGLVSLGDDVAAQLTAHQATRRPARSVRDRMPLGIDLSGRWVFLYVASDDQADDFRWFVQQRLALLAARPGWTLRLVFSPQLAPVAGLCVEQARYELSTVHADVATQLKWYYTERRAKEIDGVAPGDEERFDIAGEAFRAARYQVLYRRWLTEGDAVFEPISSSAIEKAIQYGAGRIESHVLPFSYHHLSPLVGETRSTSKGAEEGDETPTRPRPLVDSSSAAASGYVARLDHASA